MKTLTFPRKSKPSSRIFSRHYKIESVSSLQLIQPCISSPSMQDTIVRYSAAKAVARISERLPSDFSEQVFDNVIQLFSIHSVAAASLYDMPAIAESTWHGTSLACAEMARRGLVPDNRLGELIGWMRKVSSPSLRSK